MFDHESNMLLLRNHLLTYLGSNPVSGLSVADPWSQWAFAGRTFEPTDFQSASTPKVWVEEAYAPVLEAQTSIGMQEVQGISRWIVHYPFGIGTKEVGTVAKAIAEAFAPASSIVDSGPLAQHIRLVRTERLPGRPDSNEKPSWWQQIVDVRWLGFTNNP